MVVFDKLEDFWNYIQDNTFDKLAEKSGVKYIEIEGVDFERSSVGVCYTLDSMKTLWKKRDDFDVQAKDKHPILFFLMRTYPDFLGSIVYSPGKLYRVARKYFKHFFYKKHNIVKTGLPVGYWDIDTRLVHAIKTLCIEFVELECDNMFKIYYDDEVTKENQGIDYLRKLILDHETTPENIEGYRNIIDCYQWFKFDRQVIVDLIESPMEEPFDVDEYIKQEDTLYSGDTKYSHLLCSFRSSLWT